MARNQNGYSESSVLGCNSSLRFIDKFVEVLLENLRNPKEEILLIQNLLIDLSLKARSLPEHKAWETLASITSLVATEGKFPSFSAIRSVKADTNARHRNKEFRTSEILDSLTMFELGERAVKKFFSAGAWKGMPGFTEDGKPLK